MNNTQRGVLILIKSAITGESYDLPGDFSMDEAFTFVKKRHLIPLMYTGAVHCGISKQEPVMLRMLQYYFQYMLRSEKQVEALKQVLSEFDLSGIDYLPVKGSHMKNLYPKPELRMMGDADILIRLEQYEQIIPILKELGFTHSSDCEHHFVWNTDALNLELHQKLIPSTLTNFYNYYGDGWKLAILDEGTRYRFRSPEDEFIYLFTHFTKHYLYGGIGCRHVIDLWVYRRNFPDMDESYILSVFDELNLGEFYRNMLKVLQVWFDNVPSDEKSAMITEFIFTSGNWGSAKSVALSTSVQKRQSIRNPRLFRIYKFFRHLCPTKANLSLRYPILVKHSYLLPFFYLVRIVDALVNRPKNVRMLVSDIRYSTAENVESYEQSLEYVGLRFKEKI